MDKIDILSIFEGEGFMLERRITRDAEKTLEKMPDKHFCQVYSAIESLRVTPEPEDSKELISNVRPKRRRKDIGEYRIIYWHDETVLFIDVVGKRNDGEVYKKAKRKGIL
jgi:mRNA interferase RelE/StbE